MQDDDFLGELCACGFKTMVSVIEGLDGLSVILG